MGILNQHIAGVLEKNPAGPVITALLEKGWRALVVGGAVRDAMLGHRPEDVDLLTDADPGTVASIFGREKIRQVGQTFSVCLVNGVEVASLRCRPSDFPKGDLALRDFTINAMAWDPLEQSVIDPFDGKTDLENRVIRFTGNPADRIDEDPVRMVRGCRFATRFSGRLHPFADAAIKACAGQLAGRAAPERIRNELIRAMGLKTPSTFFRLLQQTGQLRYILPSLDRCFGLEGGPFHGETVFEHCLLVGDALPARQPVLRLAGFLHDTGKYDAKEVKDGRITFKGHETHTKPMEKDLEALRFSNAERHRIRSLVAAHMRPLAEQTSPKSVRKLLALLEELGIPQADFLRLRIADKKGNLAKSPYTLSDIRLRLEKIKKVRAEACALTPAGLALTGNDIIRVLDLAPGPEVGRIKRQLFEKVLDDPSLNRRDTLMALVATL